MKNENENWLKTLTVANSWKRSHSDIHLLIFE